EFSRIFRFRLGHETRVVIGDFQNFPEFSDKAPEEGRIREFGAGCWHRRDAEKKVFNHGMDRMNTDKNELLNVSTDSPDLVSESCHRHSSDPVKFVSICVQPWFKFSFTGWIQLRMEEFKL